MLEKEDIKQVEEIVDTKIGEFAGMVQQGFSDMQKNFDGLSGRVDTLGGTVDKLAGTVDKLVAATLDVQGDVKDLKVRVGNLEQTQEKIYDKLDGFLTLVNRHESEIAGLSDNARRIDERVTHLEAKGR